MRDAITATYGFFTKEKSVRVGRFANERVIHLDTYSSHGWPSRPLTSAPEVRRVKTSSVRKQRVARWFQYGLMSVLIALCAACNPYTGGSSGDVEKDIEGSFDERLQRLFGRINHDGRDD